MTDRNPMNEIISNHFSAILGLSGVLLTLLITTFANSRLRDKDYKLRVLDRIFEKRIESYLTLARIRDRLREMVAVNIAGNVLFCPAVFQSKEAFLEWIKNTQQVLNSPALWVLDDARIAIKVLETYLNTLCVFFEKEEEPSLAHLGVLLQDDFVSMADRLDTAIRHFLGDKKAVMSLVLMDVAPSATEAENAIAVIEETKLMGLLKELHEKEKRA
jgi:hypothetical protein